MKNWPFNTGDCLMQVAFMRGFTVFSSKQQFLFNSVSSQSDFPASQSFYHNHVYQNICVENCKIHSEAQVLHPVQLNTYTSG